jgi:hypothetical protein
MWKARGLGLRPKAFTRPTERFEPADLDRWARRGRRGGGRGWRWRAAPPAAVASNRGGGSGAEAAPARGASAEGSLLRPPPAPPPPTPRHDVLVAVDRATKDAVLRLVDPRYLDYYDGQVRLLSEYGAPGLLQVGGGGDWRGAEGHGGRCLEAQGSGEGARGATGFPTRQSRLHLRPRPSGRPLRRALPGLGAPAARRARAAASEHVRRAVLPAAPARRAAVHRRRAAARPD